MFIDYVPLMLVNMVAGLWSLVGYGAYWDHLKGFAKWTPATMRTAAQK